MDEYLFIAMAKLKADRLKLEEERRQQAALQPRREERRSSPDEQEPRTRNTWISRWNWREQS
jgi:hypothetical protein